MGMQQIVIRIAFALAILAPLVAHGDDADRQWSRINVQSIKPTLTARNVFVIRGMHNNGVRGGWTLETSYAVSEANKAVQITLAAWAPKSAAVTKNLDPVEAKVEVKELASATGKYDVIVVDRAGKELGRTTYGK